MARSLTYFILWSIVCKIECQYMDSPCPNIFQYQYDQRLGVHGLIQVRQPVANVLQLNLELSVGNAVSGGNGYIELAGISKQQVIEDVINGRPVRYRVIFPAWQNIPPRITKILVNGRLICSGPKLTTNQVPVVTTINLQNKVSLDVQPLSFNGNLPGNMPNMNDDSKDIIFYDDRPTNDNSNGNFFGNRKDRPSVHGQSNNNNIPIFEIYGIKNPHNFNPAPPMRGEPILDFIIFKPQKPNNTNNVYPNNPFFGASTMSPSNGQNIQENYQDRVTSSPKIPPMRPHIGPAGTAVRPNVPSNADTGSFTRFENICGLSLHTNTLIVYGESVAKGAYPWLAALFRVTNLGLNYTCSGSLISDRHVITAAHCVFVGEKKIRPNQLIVKLGTLNLQKWTQSKEGLNIEVESIHPHPDYMSLTSDADIAILVLSEVVIFTNHIRPLCLWTGNNGLESVIGIEGTVVGWGRDEEGNLMTAEAKQTKLPIVSQEQCLRSSQQYLYITSSRTFCAGFRNGSGPCNGDSGSGFIVKSEGRWMLRGVVSMSLATLSRSCDLKNYIVFSDASKFLPWILSFLK